MDNEKKENKVKPPRYNEKSLIKKFLCSKDGVQFLNSGIKKTHGKDFDVETEIYNLIDFFVAWSLKFPVRKSSTMSKYEFIKYLEDFCDKNGMYQMFDFIYE
ncbi:hypothetical protein NBO_444g0009 [Nosema bombycis CQ1]|uniref:Uncharacterized protein n=1 Tax=Nosema bombycis (strain CQ1 / CVCC 102059) TaxID=578461 RepID=R0MEC3_NOSB1|nr:hypothetical protein NBO_444g0009 [Nosema bombycis CQ1]|eukprot:EOB12430.1 hypothetical protein NBO_444g0009 [Nosema bombycis CQ1]